MMYVEPPVKRLSRAEQQGRTRLALLDAAIELFIETGIEATSIEEVTAQAGYSRGAFYSNFESKDDLFVQACDRFLDQLHAAVRPPDDLPPLPPGDAYARRMGRARAVLGDRASMFLAEAALYAIRHPQLDQIFAAQHQRQLEPATDFVRGTLRDLGVNETAVDIPTLANIAQALTFGLHLIGQTDPAVDPEACITVAMSFLFDGIAGRGSQSPDSGGSGAE